jgi:hypothetical protein
MEKSILTPSNQLSIWGGVSKSVENESSELQVEMLMPSSVAI